MNQSNYQANVVKNGADPLCRLCHQFNEDIPHLVCGCTVWAKTEFKERHDKVRQYIHWKICQYYGLPSADNWYTHKPEPVIENENVTILWDFEVHTDRTIKSNRPDIIIKDYETKSCFLIDMTNPSERNTTVKELEKLRKYKDLEIDNCKDVAFEDNHSTSIYRSPWIDEQKCRETYPETAMWTQPKRNEEDNWWVQIIYCKRRSQFE